MKVAGVNRSCWAGRLPAHAQQAESQGTGAGAWIAGPRRRQLDQNRCCGQEPAGEWALRAMRRCQEQKATPQPGS